MNYKTNHINQTPEITDIYRDTIGYKTDGFFVEFGVGHTIGCGSNTGFLADLGWNGLYFEPHVEYYNEALQRHKNNDVKIYNYGVGSTHQNTMIYPGDTCFPEVHETFKSFGWLPKDYLENYKTHMVTIKPVLEALEETGCPNRFDLLSVDVEGYELEIIKSMDFNKFRPKLIVIELRDLDMKFPLAQRKESQECANIISIADYNMFFRDKLNAFFVDLREVDK
tara:strand:- start:6152 stop:6823 length:672 start_codon:yes stop_codon:yes gene_type:complete